MINADASVETFQCRTEATFARLTDDQLRARAADRQPFFLYLAYNAPHSPIEPPADWLAPLLAGRREPRTGGILLARGERDEIAAKAATDPFVVNGAASFDLIEFLPARAASVNLDTLLP